MRRRWIHFIAVLFFFVGGNYVAQAAQASPARVVQVSRTDTSGSSDQAIRLTMPKFLDTAPVAPGEAYHVVWEPTAGRLSAGTQVTFDYAQQRAPGVKTLTIRYPFDVRTRRTATFTITDKAYRLGGRVTHWRARVIHDGRLLAERVSPFWSESR